MNRLFLLISLLLSSAWLPLHSAAEDPDDADLRANPEIEADVPAAEVSIPGYIRRAANEINLNGADWSGLRSRLRHVADTVVSIVHIGDSHVQADIGTGYTRRRLQARYGSAGRGIVTPLRIAGTNEPRDYTFTSPDGIIGSRLLKMPWPTEMAFTGCAAAPANPGEFRLRLSAREPFDSLRVHATGPGLLWRDRKAPGKVLDIPLDRAVTETEITLAAPPGTAIGGIELLHGHDGLLYHAFGNNGATYSTYCLIGGVGRDLAALSPDLIIVSLGTNEAFGRLVPSAFTSAMDELVTDMRRHNPRAEILLVTPAECYRRTTRTVTRRGKGKRRRRTRVTSYAVNQNIARVRDLIMDYGRTHHIPVYDWYSVAGGAGSAARWLADGTLGRDRIHLSAAGYRLQGELTAQALIKALEN